MINIGIFENGEKVVGYKVYVIHPDGCYDGTSLVAARDVKEANDYISRYKKFDENNEGDSYGYSMVTEDDLLEDVYSSRSGIISYGIHYRG